MSIKINTLQIENIKRVKAVALNPAENGLTVIGGKNGQGKTSVLDAIAWALGGDRYRPSNPEREGSTLPPHIKLTLSNGLTVERSGKNSALKVVDTTGKRSGQQLLNEFVEQLAIDLPRFLQASNREKADTLLQVIGVGDRIHELEAKERDVYNRRRMIGQDADRKRKYADELPFYPAAPKELVSALDLIRQQQTFSPETEKISANGCAQTKSNTNMVKPPHTFPCSRASSLRRRSSSHSWKQISKSRRKTPSICKTKALRKSSAVFRRSSKSTFRFAPTATGKRRSKMQPTTRSNTRS